MLSQKELEGKLREIIETYNEKGERAATKVLENVIQEEKSKVADSGLKAVMTTIDIVAENMRKKE